MQPHSELTLLAFNFIIILRVNGSESVITYSKASWMTLNVFALSLGEKPPQKNMPTSIDTSFLESKDVLLQMLEKKLKEIKDNKKLKNGNSDFLPKNVDFNLRSNGISAVGDAELLLRYGKYGQGTVNLTANGISNVGRVQVVVGTGNNGLHIPGLGNLFVGSSSIKSEARNDQNQLQFNPNDIDFGFRRQTNVSSATNTDGKLNIKNPATDNVEAKQDVAKVETSSNVAVGNTYDANNAVSGPIGDNSNTVNVNVAITPGQTVAVSNSPVISSGPAIKSDTVPVNTVASNTDNVNKVK